MALRGQHAAKHLAGQLDLIEPCPFLRFEILADFSVRLDEERRKGSVRKFRTVETVSARTPEGVRRRKQIAREVISESVSVSEFARRLGIGSQTACKWLRSHAPELHEQLLDQPHPIVMSRHERLARLLAIHAGMKAGLTQPVIAERLTLSRQVLRNWLRTWAPDGIEDAIDLERIDPDEEAWVIEEMEAA